MIYMREALVAILVLTSVSCFYSTTITTAVHAITINQGTRHIELTSQDGVAVSENGGNATTDNGVAVARGSGALSDAAKNSVAVSNTDNSSLSTSLASNGAVANSNAK